jgi:transposase
VLLRTSLVPPKPIRTLRNLTRYRKSNIRDRQREANRLHKILEDTAIKLVRRSSGSRARSSSRSPRSRPRLNRCARSPARSAALGETRRYRRFTAQQKLELVMAGWRGERSSAELCRRHDISEGLLRRWRERALEAGIERFAAGEQRWQGAEQRRRIAELERALGRKIYELEIAGRLVRDWE